MNHTERLALAGFIIHCHNKSAAEANDFASQAGRASVTVPNAISEGLNAAGGFVKKRFAEGINNVKNVANNSAIGQAARGLGSASVTAPVAVQEGVRGATQAVGNTVNRGIDALGAASVNAPVAIQEGARGAVQAVGNAAGAARNTVAQAADTLGAASVNLPVAVQEGARGLAQGATRAVAALGAPPTAPVAAAAPTPPPPAAAQLPSVASSGPSDIARQQFAKAHGGPFDPNSSMDRGKMRDMQRMTAAR